MSHLVGPESARITHLRAADRIGVPWRNGGGITHELLRGVSAGTQFDWRVSIAEVASDGPFSVFEGFRRWITVIAGAGMALEFENGESLTLRPFEVHELDGARGVTGVLVGGPVLDLNLIYDPHRVKAALQIVRNACTCNALADTIVLLVNVQHHPAWCTAGNQSFELAPLDALCSRGGGILKWLGPSPHARVTVEPVAPVTRANNL